MVDRYNENSLSWQIDINKDTLATTKENIPENHNLCNYKKKSRYGTFN
jgi:hypothetical protein